MLKIAHRGASGYEPENTLRSFRKAIQLKCDAIELDVHLTKDDQLVVIHDETVNRTTNGKGKISNFTLKELKKLDAGKGEKIPTLQEVIKVCRNKCKLIVEIKELNSAKKVAEIVVKERFVKETIMSSNHKESLLEAKKNGINAALIYWSTKTNWGQVLFDISRLLMLPITKRLILRRVKTANVNEVNLTSPLATKGMIDFLHKNNLKVNVWVANSKNKIERLKLLAVDGIYSNFPDRIA
jgi:glycerophosphoryl diester phosphodiesterase